MNNTFVCDNPLIQHRLTLLRDKDTDILTFRKFLFECGTLISFEIARQFELTRVPIETPLEKTIGTQISFPITLVAILRAALGFVDGLATYLPNTKIGHIGLYRNEETLQPIHYYKKLPSDIGEGIVILSDPMLATGGSIIAALEHLASIGCQKNVIIACLLAAPEGIQKIRKRFVDIPIYTAAIDRELNEKGYILPGLGDAGDRQYGTF